MCSYARFPVFYSNYILSVSQCYQYVEFFFSWRDLCVHVAINKTQIFSSVISYWLFALGFNWVFKVKNAYLPVGSQIPDHHANFAQVFSWSQDEGISVWIVNLGFSYIINIRLYIHIGTGRCLAHCTVGMGKCPSARSQILLVSSRHRKRFVFRCSSLLADDLKLIICLFVSAIVLWVYTHAVTSFNVQQTSKDACVCTNRNSYRNQHRFNMYFTSVCHSHFLAM